MTAHPPGTRTLGTSTGGQGGDGGAGGQGGAGVGPGGQALTRNTCTYSTLTTTTFMMIKLNIYTFKPPALWHVSDQFPRCCQEARVARAARGRAPWGPRVARAATGAPGVTAGAAGPRRMGRCRGRAGGRWPTPQTSPRRTAPTTPSVSEALYPEHHVLMIIIY